MATWTTRHCDRHGQLWLAAAWLATFCLTVAIASPAAQVPQCQLHVTGGQNGQIAAASMSCRGRMQADIALNQVLLGSFKAGFEGISSQDRCRSNAVCLITVCSGILVLKDSSISGVRSESLDSLVCVLGNSRLEVYNSQFVHNMVRPFLCSGQAHLVLHGSNISHNYVPQGSGGGLFAEGNAAVIITGDSHVNNNSASGSGGGLVAAGNATVTLAGSSSVHNNVAHNASGGGLFVVGNASVTLAGNSSVHGNTALLGGGGMVIVGNASVIFTGGSCMHNNVVLDGIGGGLCVVDNASVTLAGGSSVHNNSASQGGGVVVADDANVTITGGSSVHNNVAHNGAGGISVGENASVALTGGSSVHNNVARNGPGGGLFVVGNASVTLTGGSSVHNNIARNASGGGINVAEDATVTLTSGSSVHNNIAHNDSGGGMIVLGNASVTLTGGSGVHNNVAPNGFGGGMFVVGNASVTLTGGSSVHHNSADDWFGGGVAAVGTARVRLYQSSVHKNTARGGGGMYAGSKARIAMSRHSRIHSNKALNGSAGGLIVVQQATATISGNCSILNNTCTGGIGGGVAVGPEDFHGAYFDDKGVRRAVPDAPGLFDGSALVEISDSTIGNNTSYRSAGGGLAVGDKGTLVLTNGTRVVNNRAVNGSGGGAVVLDRATLHVDDDVRFIDNSVNQRYVASIIAAFDSSNLWLPLRGELTKCSTGVYLGRTPCDQGETLVDDVCRCCLRQTYSFDNTSLCQPCPANAICAGGNFVEPRSGYWQSSNMSTELHRCPLSRVACNYTADSHTGTVHPCNDGYRGNLCGACQMPQYGMVSPLKCRKCMKPSVQLALYLLACCATVLFVTWTVRATWRDNLQGGQAVKPTDLIKVLVQFLQYIVIIGSISIPWPSGLNLQRWFQVASSVFGASSGEGLSLDCWLQHYVSLGALNLAIQRQLVYFLAPLGVFVAVVMLQCCTCAFHRWVFPTLVQQSSGRGLSQQGGSFGIVLRKLPVTALVLTFYAYPTLLRASLGFFACLRIDTAQARPGFPAPLNHALGYWVNDIQQECFVGYHLGWALGLGLPSILLWCVVVPVALGLGLWLFRAKANTSSFREHFGFLYRKYKPERMWWEAVWAARTVTLTLVSVFSFPMDRYFSVLALLLVFLTSAALQVAFKPYEVSTLHNMHMVSTSCLIATTLGALAMFAYDIQDYAAERVRYVIAALILITHVVFVSWCCFRLAPAVKELFLAAVADTKAACVWVANVIRGCACWRRRTRWQAKHVVTEDARQKC